MNGTCYWCNKEYCRANKEVLEMQVRELPHSRNLVCVTHGIDIAYNRLTTYCVRRFAHFLVLCATHSSQSKECQTRSWKAGHKKICRPQPALAHGEPEKYSQQWQELQLDKRISRWIEEWRGVLSNFAITSLNLANHNLERVSTHW